MPKSGTLELSHAQARAPKCETPTLINFGTPEVKPLCVGVLSALCASVRPWPRKCTLGWQGVLLGGDGGRVNPPPFVQGLTRTTKSADFGGPRSLQMGAPKSSKNRCFLLIWPAKPNLTNFRGPLGRRTLNLGRISSVKLQYPHTSHHA